jgi:hypothetical protein
MLRGFFLFVFLVSLDQLNGQALDAQVIQERFRLQVTKTETPIQIDGNFNEGVWKKAPAA